MINLWENFKLLFKKKDPLIPTIKKIRQVIANQLDIKIEDVTMEASFINDLGADSLDRIEIVMAIEELFNIEIPDEDAEKMNNINDVVKYIGRQYNK